MATNLTWVTCICGKLHIVQRFPAQCPNCKTVMDIEHFKSKRGRLRPVIVLSGKDFESVKEYITENTEDGPLIDSNKFELMQTYPDGSFKFVLKTVERNANGQNNIR